MIPTSVILCGAASTSIKGMMAAGHGSSRLITELGAFFRLHRAARQTTWALLLAPLTCFTSLIDRQGGECLLGGRGRAA
ncbi:unnamed protein product, partial [Symbiodinium microadriaticum]